MNQSIVDYFSSFFSWPKYYLNTFIRYRKTYQNFTHVFKNSFKNNFPITAILKNGEQIELHSRFDSGAITCNFKDYFHWEGDIVHITNPDLAPAKFIGAKNNGDIHTVFFKNEYSILDLKDKIVVDVGANIGDSAIYFALRGAKKVIAIEPFPENFRLAQKNIELNNLGGKIELIQAGCASHSGKITLDPSSVGPCSILSNTENGIQIPLLSLDEIIEKYHVDSGILKLDCEGCERDVILNSSSESLKKFSQLFVEYHYGYRDLESKLKKSGFSLKITRPYWNPMFTANMQIGDIVAVK